MPFAEEAALITFAFTAGAATFFAPCAYPLLPGYISYYLGQGAAQEQAIANGGSTSHDNSISLVLANGLNHFLPRITAVRTARAVTVGILVSLGFFLVYGILAGIVAAVGAQTLANISILELVVGSLLVVLGTAMAFGWKPNTPTIPLPNRQRSVFGFFGFGVVYAAAAAGCTAPIFIAVGLKAVSAGPLMGIAAFSSYAAGMSVLMIGVTVITALGRDSLLKRVNQRMGLIYRIAGGLLVIAGLVEIYFFLFRFEGLTLLGL